MVGQCHLDLDGAWVQFGSIERRDLRQWGPRLRYHGRRRDVEDFYGEIAPRLAPFVLYGSGDFHYLAAVLLRRIDRPVTVISFDNHPDWDIRPPHWSCGGWVNRALELPQVRRVCVWGCGNFELALPHRLFANRKALRDGRLEVHAWAERQKPGVCRLFNCMTRDNWRQRFEQFAGQLQGQNVYVTIDLDCLRAEEVVTNWENGLFTVADLEWALKQLRGAARMVAGDLCGAWSEPFYARRFQRLIAEWDHPKFPRIDLHQAGERNRAAVERIWNAMVCRDPALSCPTRAPAPP